MLAAHDRGVERAAGHAGGEPIFIAGALDRLEARAQMAPEGFHVRRARAAIADSRVSLS